MTQIVLTDEINRATPKTQAALLEVMEERQVTVDGTTHLLPKPFMVLATQNPIEYEGTFQLPEAELDRFLLCVQLGYPSLEDEVLVLEQQQFHHPVEDLEPVVSTEEVLEAQELIKDVYVSPAVKRYIVELVDQTRQHADVYLGASPRGSLTLYRAGQVQAAMQGRDYVLPDDIKALTVAALGHRVIVGPRARLKGLSSENILQSILDELPIPEGDLNPQG
jgi:MoxR-like ATPase